MLQLNLSSQLNTTIHTVLQISKLWANYKQIEKPSYVAAITYKQWTGTATRVHVLGIHVYSISLVPCINEDLPCLPWYNINIMKHNCNKNIIYIYIYFLYICVNSLNSYSASCDNWCTVGGDGGCRVGEVRAGTTSPMPDHKGFKLQ